MHWMLAFSVVLLLTMLTSLFVFAARAIRRDMDERFERFRVRLEDEANHLVQDLLNPQNECER